MNPLYPSTTSGTLGELLVQMRLLEYDVQASFPLKDSGNDLIALRGRVVKAIQVKSSSKARYGNRPKDTKIYDFLAAVHLRWSSEGRLLADKSKIFFLRKNDVYSERTIFEKLANYEITRSLVDELWSEAT
jgi:hypothetical protein